MLALLVFHLFVLCPFNASASDIVFHDNFDDGDAIGWDEYSPNGSWYVDGGSYIGTASPGEIKVLHYSRYGEEAWSNYSLQVDVKAIDTVDKIVFFRFDNNGSTYSVNLRSSYPGGGNDIVLDKFTSVDGLSVRRLRGVPFSNIPNEWYTLLIEANNVNEGVEIVLYVNGLRVLEYTDNNEPIFAGGIAVVVWPEGTQTTHFDNVYIRSLGDAHLPVPDIKQYDDPWGVMEYDTASSWSTDPTIARWGCALTSSAMVLQYHGHDIDPGALNDWLNGEPDGYVRDGLVNWLAISRYTLDNSSASSPTLEYRRYSPGSADLTAEFEAERPPILKVPGHFVVGKGEQDDDIAINDPASTNELFSDLGKSLVSVGIYTPSETDLSYIMLVVNDGVQISVENSGGAEVGENFTEGPIVDAIDGIDQSGETVSMYLLPKPDEGEYRITLSGQSGVYDLDAYIYDTLGNVEIFDVDGTLSNSDKVIGLTVDHTGGSSVGKTISFESIKADLLGAYDNELIYKVSIYDLLLKHIENAEERYDVGIEGASVRILEATVHLLEVFTPRFVDEDISILLREEIMKLVVGM